METKRRNNLAKHGLDFADADLVLDNPLIYVPGRPPRIVSFRHAGLTERTAYHDWLENDFDDDAGNARRP